MLEMKQNLRPHVPTQIAAGGRDAMYRVRYAKMPKMNER